ncbi:c-type cytochrome [Burkholderia cenocepacia]|uniref:c-type cytochrome n=2 Tax=Burkholderia cenocepacia TaxID=95486 RepID=UPI000D0C37B8|nr:cytochrome c [Burkholderia cenocepacia]SOT44236.1 Cytochrome c-552 (modular protein) [Burkholderia cenocepacia]
MSLKPSSRPRATHCAVGIVTIFAMIGSCLLTTKHVDAAETADSAAGQAKFALCIACHGADGRTPTSPGFPKISGQNPSYVAAALHAYKSGQRNGGLAHIMQPMAEALSDQDIDNLASYIATLGADK